MFGMIKRLIGWTGKYKKRVYIGFIYAFINSIFTSLPIMLATYGLGLVFDDYKGIRTAMHIVENNDRQGIKNIAKYLSDDARMIYDNRTGNEKLYCQIDLACEISRNLYNHFLH